VAAATEVEAAALKKLQPGGCRLPVASVLHVLIYSEVLRF
jgi:hypothetical protein